MVTPVGTKLYFVNKTLNCLYYALSNDICQTFLLIAEVTGLLKHLTVYVLLNQDMCNKCGNLSNVVLEERMYNYYSYGEN